MIYSWVSFALFSLGVVVHVGFFVFEVFLYSKPKFYSRFGETAQSNGLIRPWAFNVGFYNLGVAIITAYGLVKVLQTDIRVAGALVSAGGFIMILAGFALWISVPRLRPFALLQALPPALGFGFLALHIADRTGAL